MNDVTRILIELQQDETKSTDELLPLVYDELRRMAAQKLSQERSGQVLQATSLVHEAYVRLVESPSGSGWQGARHFYAAAAEAMRRILVDNARKLQRQKHGGRQPLLALPDVESPAGTNQLDILLIDEALAKLGQEDPQKAELVKLRYFAGLSLDEVAKQLGISRATTSRYWTYARAWLYDYMFDAESS